MKIIYSNTEDRDANEAIKGLLKVREQYYFKAFMNGHNTFWFERIMGPVAVSCSPILAIGCIVLNMFSNGALNYVVSPMALSSLFLAIIGGKLWLWSEKDHYLSVPYLHDWDYIKDVFNPNMLFEDTDIPGTSNYIFDPKTYPMGVYRIGGIGNLITNKKIKKNKELLEISDVIYKSAWKLKKVRDIAYCSRNVQEFIAISKSLGVKTSIDVCKAKKGWDIDLSRDYSMPEKVHYTAEDGDVDVYMPNQSNIKNHIYLHISDELYRMIFKQDGVMDFSCAEKMGQEAVEEVMSIKENVTKLLPVQEQYLLPEFNDDENIIDIL